MHGHAWPCKASYASSMHGRTIHWSGHMSVFAENTKLTCNGKC